MFVSKCFTFILEGCQHTSFLQHHIKLHTSLHITSWVTVGLMFALTRKVPQHHGVTRRIVKNTNCTHCLHLKQIFDSTDKTCDNGQMYTSLQKHLGYLGCLSCINMFKECNFRESSLRSFSSLVRLACLFLKKAYLATFLPQPCNQATLPGQMNNINKPHQKYWFVDFLKRDTNLTKWRSLTSQLYTLIQTVSTPWTLRVSDVTHTKGMQVRWPKCGWSNLNLFTVKLS